MRKRHTPVKHEKGEMPRAILNFRRKIMAFETNINLISKFAALKIFAGLRILSLFSITIFIFGLMLIQNQSTNAQAEKIEDSVLEKLLAGTKRAKTIKEIPVLFREAVKRKYESSPNIKREAPKFEPYLATVYFWTMEQIDLKAGKILSNPQDASGGICDDGGCEELGQIGKNVWKGYYTGNIWWGRLDDASLGNMTISGWTDATDASNPTVIKNDASIPIDYDYGTPTTNFADRCDDHSAQAHFTVVNTANDPMLGALLKTTAPIPSNNRAIRMGNMCIKDGGERLEKSFVVQPGQTTLSFWYAAVMQNPNHELLAQPGFAAYLFANGVNISNKIDIDPANAGVQNFLAANASNSFFTPYKYNSSAYSSTNPWDMLYRPWTYVSVDLSAHIGQTVTVVFVNRDCLHAGDFAYAYIDGFCATGQGNPTGWAEFAKDDSKDCGTDGKVCIKYTVPRIQSPATGVTNFGTATISLQRYQNGVPVGAPISSGVLSKDGVFCFPASKLMTGINGDFDWTAVVNYTPPAGVSATISPTVIGKQGDGNIAGQNNDFKKECKNNCCGVGKNYVVNGDFSNGTKVLKTEYDIGEELFPGNVFVINGEKAEKICGNWSVRGHAGGKCEDPNDPFLMVNGLTSQQNSNPKSVWMQQVKIDGEGEYEFCAYFKDMKQCCFNQQPKITLKAAIMGKEVTQTATISTTTKPCDWKLVSTKITVPAGVSIVGLEILLDESVNGDGNDLAIDDISLTKKEPVAASFLTTNPQLTENSTGNKFTIKTNTPLPPNPDCKTIWKAVEFKRDANGMLIKDTNGELVPDMSTYKEWINPVSPFIFPGYNSTFPSAGVFDSAKLYRITYGVECECSSYRSRSWRVGLEDSSTQFRATQPRKPGIKEEITSIKNSPKN